MKSTGKTHWPSLGMLLLSGGGSFLAFGSAVGFAVAGLIILLQGMPVWEQARQLFNLACASGLIFFLLLPSTILAAIRLMGKPVPTLRLPRIGQAANIGFFLLPVLISTGYLLTRNAGLAALSLPWLQLAVVAIPLLWVLETGRKNLSSFSAQQSWGLFSFSVTFTMPFIIIVEFLLITGIVVCFLIYLGITNPSFLNQLTITVERIVNSSADRDTIIRILRPYINQPALMYAFFGIMAGLVPLLEELFKPLALWFFSGRSLTPRQGFIGGMICGAAFALLESLGALASPAADEWAVVAVGRVGTGILHITASGLMGWGMVKAWSAGRYGLLAAAYALAVSFHALWNTSALMAGMGELAVFSPAFFGMYEGYILVSPFILFMLAACMVFWVVKANQSFQTRAGEVDSN